MSAHWRESYEEGFWLALLIVGLAGRCLAVKSDQETFSRPCNIVWRRRLRLPKPRATAEDLLRLEKTQMIAVILKTTTTSYA
jgi:hypothetical protein